MAIALFALFVSIARFSRAKVWQDRKVVMSGVVITVGILLSLPAQVHTYNTQRTALEPINNRNQAVAQIVTHHKVNTLVGDYWRVIPTKAQTTGKLSVSPLADCTKPSQLLNSNAWQPDLRKNSFAYLLSLDASLSNYPRCSVDQVIGAYGKPKR